MLMLLSCGWNCSSTASGYAGTENGTFRCCNVTAPSRSRACRIKTGSKGYAQQNELCTTRQVLVEGKSPVCPICMKYWIIILLALRVDVVRPCQLQRINSSVIRYVWVCGVCVVCVCVCVCLRACVRACVRANMRACVIACVRACVRACVSACVRACVCECVCACVRACVRTCEHACLRACVRV